MSAHNKRQDYTRRVARRNVCYGIDRETLDRLNEKPSIPPRQCPKCGEKLHYWVDREVQNIRMGWSYPARFTFCCPNCRKFDIK